VRQALVRLHHLTFVIDSYLRENIGKQTLMLIKKQMKGLRGGETSQYGLSCPLSFSMRNLVLHKKQHHPQHAHHGPEYFACADLLFVQNHIRSYN
jgi:hypothetical protein